MRAPNDLPSGTVVYDAEANIFILKTGEDHWYAYFVEDTESLRDVELANDDYRVIGVVPDFKDEED